MSISPELRAFIVGVVEERIRELKVAREEFEELRKAILKLADAQSKTEARIEELARAQARTEARLEELAEAQAKTEARVEELAKAQARTEARLKELVKAQARTEARLEELAEAQAKTEARIEELARAQAETEVRLGFLAEAQAKTESRLENLALKVEELVEAQARTEKAIARLAFGLDALRVEVGRLSETVGFGLEDLAKEFLPYRLQRDGLKVERVERRFLVVDGEEVEVNLYGEAVLEGEPVVIVGEVKSRIYSDDVRRTARLAKRIEASLGRRVYPLLFGYAVHPSALEEAEKLKIRLYTAYQP